MLHVQQATKHYAERSILRSVSFSVQAGERIALLGPSGCGKTTLLNCIGGIDRLDSGHVRLLDKDIAFLDGEALSALRRRHIGTVFQFFHLLPTMTAFENIELPLQLLNVDKSERSARVNALLQRTGIAHRADALPEQLSGGEMQRVAIARALVHKPSLILADEPTGNLDSTTGAQVLELLRCVSEEEGAAMVMVTHSEEAAKICNRTLRMLDGELV
jgi:ABC-type lipoprotein export system ATPase subunit